MRATTPPMAKTLAIFLFFAHSLCAQQPINVFVGKITTAARKLGPESIQLWVRDTATQKVLQNLVITANEEGIYQYYYYDRAAGTLDSSVVWSFWRNANGDLSWQATVTIGGKEFPALNGVF